MEKETNPIQDQEHWQDIESYWDRVREHYLNNEPNQVEELLMERKDFHKMLGEEEMFEWLKENLARMPRLELKKGVIKPISEEKLGELTFNAEQKMREKIHNRERKKKL